MIHKTISLQVDELKEFSVHISYTPNGSKLFKVYLSDESNSRILLTDGHKGEILKEIEKERKFFNEGLDAICKEIENNI